MEHRIRNLFVEKYTPKAGDALAVEIVERKGVGHPDTICDGVAEAVARSLRLHYQNQCGRILHHNVDKVLLRAGAARAGFGGGHLEAPLEVYVCGRATAAIAGKPVPLTELCEAAVKDWFRANLRYLDPERHVRVINLIRPGSEALTRLFDRDVGGSTARSNDTSIGVGFAPLSRLERAVLEVDSNLRSSAFRQELPFAGDDIKIMAVRNREKVGVTLACAFVARFVADLQDYLDKKALLADRVRAQLERLGFGNPEVLVNGADDPGEGSVYLTVTGTSAEAGDDGEVGRGNRANGLITPCRPMTLEAFAGKNPVSHTGRIYQLWAQAAAERISAELGGLVGVECFLVSQIGAPVDQPQLINVRIDPGAGNELGPGHERICEGVLETVMRGAQ